MRRHSDRAESDQPRSDQRRQRLDQALVTRGLAESRTSAQSLVLAGEVRLDGELALRASQMVGAEQRLELVARPAFVSRGGDKLAAALETFGLSVRGMVCADIGASTGGFTDCLLSRGATRVYAIDVGHGILHWKLRQDPRVVVMERTNARHLSTLPEAIDIVTIDVAFISLRHILPMAAAWIRPGKDVVALVKPQFEAGKGSVGKGGVVRDPAVHRRVLEETTAAAARVGLGPQRILRSPLHGPKGNIEFLLWAVKGGEARPMVEEIHRAIGDPSPSAVRRTIA